MFTMEITRLIERCRLGDTEALGELYKAYAQKMKGVCRRYVSDEQDIDDVLHDAFVIIFTSFDKLRDDSKAEAWMMSITRNVASKYKDHLMTRPFVPLKEAEQLPMPEDDGEYQSSKAEVRGVPLEDVLRLIERLPEGYGQVFRLSVFDGLSHKEIADMLGIEPHSSSSQLSRAKKMLRKMMLQYWAAILLLLLIPLTFFLLKDEEAIVKEDKPVVAKQKKSESEPQTAQQEPPMKRAQKPVFVHVPVRILAGDTLQSEIAETVDTAKADTLYNILAQDLMIPDNTATDSTAMIHKEDIPYYDITEALFPEKPTSDANNEKKWSLELAYAAQLDEQNHYNQPFSYKPYIDPNIQHSPGEGPTYVTPSSIDNWSDYAVYLANNPDAVSAKTRSFIMRIALYNATRPGNDKILRTSHHQMPMTWSLALKYRLDNRFGLESGFSYSRLTSDFEMGAEGYSISEQQTIHYLGIPMKGIYNMYGGKLWSLYGSIGLTTEIPVHSALNSYYYVNGLYEGNDKGTIRAPWQFSTTLGLGLQIHLMPNVGFFIEPSLQYYIPMKSGIETYRTEHPFTFSLPLGIRFTW